MINIITTHILNYESRKITENGIVLRKSSTKESYKYSPEQFLNTTMKLLS